MNYIRNRQPISVKYHYLQARYKAIKGTTSVSNAIRLKIPLQGEDGNYHKDSVINQGVRVVKQCPPANESFS